MPTETLEIGPRIALRHPAAEDMNEWISLRESSRALHEPWEPLPTDGSNGRDAAAFERFLIASNAEHRQRQLLIERATGRIVGACSLNNIVRESFCSAAVGYWIGAPFAGKGLMSEGLALTVRRAFTSLGLHRIEANIIPANQRSIAVARRCGFSREGYSPRFLRIAGTWQDHERWAITIEDWQAQHPRSAHPVV